MVKKRTDTYLFLLHNSWLRKVLKIQLREHSGKKAEVKCDGFE